MQISTCKEGSHQIVEGVGGQWCCSLGDTGPQGITWDGAHFLWVWKHVLSRRTQHVRHLLFNPGSKV